MHFVTSDGRVVPCKYDQGTECYVVMKREFDPESEELDFLFVDDEEVEIVNYEIVDDTRRTFFISVYDEPEDDEEADGSESAKSEFSYDDEDTYHGYAFHEVGSDNLMEELTGSPYGTINYED